MLPRVMLAVSLGSYRAEGWGLHFKETITTTGNGGYNSLTKNVWAVVTRGIVPCSFRFPNGQKMRPQAHDILIVDLKKRAWP